MDEVFVVWGRHNTDGDFFVAGMKSTQQSAEDAAERLNFYQDRQGEYVYTVGRFAVTNN